MILVRSETLAPLVFELSITWDRAEEIGVRGEREKEREREREREREGESEPRADSATCFFDSTSMRRNREFLPFIFYPLLLVPGSSWIYLESSSVTLCTCGCALYPLAIAFTPSHHSIPLLLLRLLYIPRDTRNPLNHFATI